MAQPMLLQTFMSSNSLKQGDSFMETGRLIAGENPPQWLAKHLQRWSASVMLDGNVFARQAGKADVRARLKKLDEDAELVERELRDPIISDLLQAEPLGPMPNPTHLFTALQEVNRRSGIVLSPDPLPSLEMRDRLEKLRDGAGLVVRELQDSTIAEFLQGEEEGFLLASADLGTALNDIRRRADVALSSLYLATKAGKTKAGRGRALPPKASSPRGFCAAVILEAWAYFHDGEYPAASNLKLAAAAEEYWRVCGGQTAPWGEDPLKAWRPYFVEASRPSLTKIREELRRHVKLSAEKSH